MVTPGYGTNYKFAPAFNPLCSRFEEDCNLGLCFYHDLQICASFDSVLNQAGADLQSGPLLYTISNSHQLRIQLHKTPQAGADLQSVPLAIARIANLYQLLSQCLKTPDLPISPSPHHILISSFKIKVLTCIKILSYAAICLWFEV
jgi:hypothetical protein